MLTTNVNTSRTIWVQLTGPPTPSDSIKQKTAYKQLPFPINAKFIFNIILSLSSQLVIIVALIVVVVLFVDSYQNSTVEIIIAGMRPPTYAQMQYFTL
ncbi:MAG: hypothetical protein EZS28_043802, partial [Streblomastix strix]